MQIKNFSVSATTCLLLVMLSPGLYATSSGPPAALSGAPAVAGDTESDCVQCHNTYSIDPDSDGKLELLGLPATYSPGKRYQLAIRISHPLARRWGFQLTALARESLLQAGDFSPLPGNSTTQRVAGGDRVYIQHGGNGRAATGAGTTSSYTWEFVWDAPLESVEEVLFFGLGNAANMDGSQGGDRIYGPAGKPLARTRAEQ